MNNLRHSRYLYYRRDLHNAHYSNNSSYTNNISYTYQYMIQVIKVTCVIQMIRVA